MSNLDLYNRVRVVPEEAKKPIGAGRLRGMTDINPMWRIKKLTEEFGQCGVGWCIRNVKYDVISADGLLVANCTLELITKGENGWNEPIFGVGGAMLIAKEQKGNYVDDEAYKKAYTDAISVACKALGIGADVYWDKDRTKYSGNPTPETEQKPSAHALKYMHELIEALCNAGGYNKDWVIKNIENTIRRPIAEFSDVDVGKACKVLNIEITKAATQKEQGNEQAGG